MRTSLLTGVLGFSVQPLICTKCACLQLGQLLTVQSTVRAQFFPFVFLSHSSFFPYPLPPSLHNHLLAIMATLVFRPKKRQRDVSILHLPDQVLQVIVSLLPPVSLPQIAFVHTTFFNAVLVSRSKDIHSIDLLPSAGLHESSPAPGRTDHYRITPLYLRLAGPHLRTLRLHSNLSIKHTTQALRAAAEYNPCLSRVAFADNESLDPNVCTKLFSSLAYLVSVEIHQPSLNCIQALMHTPHVLDVALTSVRSEVLAGPVMQLIRSVGTRSSEYRLALSISMESHKASQRDTNTVYWTLIENGRQSLLGIRHLSLLFPYHCDWATDLKEDLEILCERGELPFPPQFSMSLGWRSGEVLFPARGDGAVRPRYMTIIAEEVVDYAVTNRIMPHWVDSAKRIIVDQFQMVRYNDKHGPDVRPSAIRDGFRLCTQLHTLDIDLNSTPAYGLRTAYSIMASCPTVSQLTVNRRCIRDHVFDSWGALLCDYGHRLKVFKVRVELYEPVEEIEDSAKFAEQLLMFLDMVLEKCKELQVFYLPGVVSSGRVGSNTARVLWNALQKFSQIEVEVPEVDMSTVRLQMEQWVKHLRR